MNIRYMPYKHTCPSKEESILMKYLAENIIFIYFIQSWQYLQLFLCKCSFLSVTNNKYIKKKTHIKK